MRIDMNGFKATSDEIVAFVEVYKTSDLEEGDHHQEFADKLNLSRNDAKGLCHKINYYYNMGVFPK